MGAFPPCTRVDRDVVTPWATALRSLLGGLSREWVVRSRWYGATPSARPGPYGDPTENFTPLHSGQRDALRLLACILCASAPGAISLLAARGDSLLSPARPRLGSLCGACVPGDLRLRAR